MTLPKFAGAAIAAIVLGVVLCIGWLVGDDMTSFTEVQRRTSPDGSLDAVIVESNGGATTDYGYFVCVVPPGGACDVDDAVAMTYGSWCSPPMRGLEAIWDGPSELRLVYLTSRRSELRDSAPKIDGRRVSVVLHPGRCGHPLG